MFVAQQHTKSISKRAQRPRLNDQPFLSDIVHVCATDNVQWLNGQTFLFDHMLEKVTLWNGFCVLEWL